MTVHNSFVFTPCRVSAGDEGDGDDAAGENNDITDDEGNTAGVGEVLGCNRIDLLLTTFDGVE